MSDTYTQFRSVIHGMIGVALAFAMALQSGANPVSAQTAAELTDRTFQPTPLRASGGSVVFSGQPGHNVPAGADQLTVQLARVTVEGTLPGMEAITAQFVERLTRGRILVSEIFVGAASLEAAYAEAGYVLARIVLPAQTLVDGGPLRLVVVNGFVERIDDAAVPEPLRQRLQVLTQPLVGRPGLKLGEIERRLLLAGDTFGVALGSALASGSSPGGTVIILDPRYRRVTGFVEFDNGYSDALGTFNATLGVEMNSFFGRGESLYFRLSGNPRLGDGGWFDDDPRFRTVAAGLVFPLGTDGLTFNVEATQSRTNPDTFPSTSSAYERLSFRLYYPLRRSRSVNLTTQFSLDVDRSDLDLVVGAIRLPLHKDRVSVLRASADAVMPLGQGVFQAGAILSVGVDAFGARTADDATPDLPLSRDGADAVFRKLELSASYGRTLGQGLRFTVEGQAQTSFGDPLVSSELFGIASLQNLPAFDEGAISGDAGWLVKAKLAAPREVATQIGPVQAVPYVFGAVGEVHRERPSIDEAANVQATTYGLGIEIFRLSDTAFNSASLKFEYAIGNRSDTGGDERRFNVVGSIRF